MPGQLRHSDQGSGWHRTATISHISPHAFPVAGVNSILRHRLDSQKVKEENIYTSRNKCVRIRFIRCTLLQCPVYLTVCHFGPDHPWCAPGNALTNHCACVSTLVEHRSPSKCCLESFTIAVKQILPMIFAACKQARSIVRSATPAELSIFSYYG